MITLNHNEWYIVQLEPFGWFVVNDTHWGKSYTDSTGKAFFSGWNACYLHKDGSIQPIADYFATEELAKEALTKVRAKHE